MRSFVVRSGSDARLLERLRDQMDHAVQEWFGSFPDFSWSGLLSSGAVPVMNIWENEANVYAECEIPGARMSDLDVSVVGNELRIRGGRRDESVANATVHRTERRTGSFERAIRLPVEIDAQNVTADLSAGVLTVTLPKAKAALPRKIAVQTSEE